MEHLYYKPSGKTPVKGLIISIVTAFILTVGFSILYIALQWFIPFIYFNFFIAVGLGAGVAVSLFIAIGLGKIRNTQYDFLLAIVCGVLGWYSQWALFVSLMYRAEGNMGGDMWVRSSFSLTGFWSVFTHPEALFQSMITLNRAGTFSLKHNVATGAFLWTIWVIEAVIIIALPIFLSVSGRARQPFSEQNNNWMDERDLEGKLKTVENADALITELGSGNLRALKNFLQAEEVGNDYATVRIYESQGDPVGYITVTNVSHVMDKKGELKKTTKIVIEYFRIMVAGF